jgi:hypothetical protein
VFTISINSHVSPELRYRPKCFLTILEVKLNGSIPYEKNLFFFVMLCDLYYLLDYSIVFISIL